MLLEADVEPHRAVERGLLIDEQVLQVVAERQQVVFAREVVLPARPGRDGVDDAADQLLDGTLTLRRTDGAAEILGDDDVGGLLGPEAGNLDVALLEDDRALFVADHGGADVPFDLVERIDPFLGEEALGTRAQARRRAAPVGSRCACCWIQPGPESNSSPQRRHCASSPLRIREPSARPRQ